MVEMRDVLKDYWIGEQLGTGARSVIHEVERKSDGEKFAVKFVNVRSDEDLQIIRHLENEHKVLMDVHSKGGEGAEFIVRALEFQKIKKFFKVKAAYLIQERARGVDLAHEWKYPLENTINIFIQACRALEALHKVGYVHADLKPDNILVDDQFGVKLIDFGFAAPIGQKISGFKGTWGYVAPEQAGGRITGRTDVFNLGAALYWVLTGEMIPSIMPEDRARGGFVPDEQIELTPPSRVNPEVPEDLSDVVVQCCAVEDLKRPSMTELRRFLYGLVLRMEMAK